MLIGKGSGQAHVRVQAPDLVLSSKGLMHEKVHEINVASTADQSACHWCRQQTSQVCTKMEESKHGSTLIRS